MADDARSKLEAALASAKARQAKGPTSAPPSPPPKSAPARSASSAPSRPAPKPKKKKAPKKKGPGLGDALGKKFSSFASTVVDELKSATSEISPGALIASANDSLQSIKKAVGFDEDTEPENDRAKTKQSAAASDNDSETPPQDVPGDIQRTSSSLPIEPDIEPQAPSNSNSDSPPEYTSPAKVIKMPSKKKKVAPEDDEPTDEAAGEETTPEATSDTAATSETQPSEQATPTDDAPMTDGPAGMTSPSKVQRAPSKKKSIDDDEEEDGEDSDETPPATAEETSEDEAPATAENETPTEATSESDSAEPKEEKVNKPPPKPVVVSKTEHTVRTFQALQIVLTNPVWAPIVTDLTTKPSTLFAPRAHFDTQFTDPVFRDGLKAASRLATAYAFDPEKIRFNQKIIGRVTAVELDPEGNFKPHTERITSVIAPEIVEQVLDLLDNGHIKHLLFSVGTRLGSFVPTIESLARIYLTLRKKTELSSGDRLQIQEEIMMRYKKAPYTDDMGKRARNLALNYFMDYLAEYAFKLYQDRFDNTPEGQDNIESHYRRYNTVTTFCRSTVDDWCSKIAISAQAIESIHTKFEEMASDHFREKIGAPPPSDS